MTVRVGRLPRAATRRLDLLVGGSARRHVVVVFAAVLGLDSADKAVIGVGATQLQNGLAIGRSEIGLLLAVSSLVGAAATIPAGMLVDRICRTRLLAWAVASWALAMIASGLATGFVFLVLAQVGLGCVTAAASPAIASMIGDYFPTQERGRIYGYVLSGELLGAGFGFLVAGQFASLSWRAPFLVLAVPSLFVWWLVYRLPEPARGGASRLVDGADGMHSLSEVTAGRDDSPDATADPAAPTAPHRTDTRPGEERVSLWQAVRYVLSIRTNVVLIVASALGYFFFSCLRGFGVEFVKRHYGVGQSMSTLVILVLGIGAFAGVLAGGRIADWLQQHGRVCARLEIPGVGVPLAGLLFVPAMITTRLWLAMVLLLGAALSLGMSNPPLDAARLDIVRPPMWGRAEAVRSVLRSSADAVAPVLFGVISESVFVGARALEYTFLLMLVTLFAAGAVVLTVGRRTFPRDLAAAQGASGLTPTALG